jgi:hypothetical protein
VLLVLLCYCVMYACTRALLSSSPQQPSADFHPPVPVSRPLTAPASDCKGRGAAPSTSPRVYQPEAIIRGQPALMTAHGPSWARQGHSKGLLRHVLPLCALAVAACTGGAQASYAWAQLAGDAPQSLAPTTGLAHSARPLATEHLRVASSLQTSATSGIYFARAHNGGHELVGAGGAGRRLLNGATCEAQSQVGAVLLGERPY